MIRGERELNSPTPLTLRLLAVIFIATFIPWVGAKVACNEREAPVRAPFDLPTDVLAKQPKSAALELQQRVATHQYRQAAELAKGALAEELLAADARCQAEPQPCEERRAQQGRIFTRAVLVSRGPGAARVRAETRIGEQLERVAMLLEPDAGRWYVVSRAPFAGEIDAPVSPEEAISPIMIRPVSDPHAPGPAPPMVHGAASPRPSPPPSPSAPPPSPP
jgi:hypothetical protein